MRIAATVAAVVAWAALAFALTFPTLTGRVVDEAGILDQAQRSALTQKLADLETKSTDQLVVVTLKSLQGTSVEDYGYQLGRHWGIGEKGKNNGALLIVAPNEHEVRIEVGYGLEGDLTDAKSRIIIERVMKPDFKKGTYDAGVLGGTKAVLGTLGNTNYAAPDYQRYERDNDEPSGWMTALIIFALVFFFSGRSFFWPLLFMGGFGGGRGGGWGGGGFGGGGGGGFSGGGGSFGGGGASGRW